MVPQLYDRTNNVSDHIIERTALPDHLIKGVSGKAVFHAEHQLVGGYQCQCIVYHFTLQVAPLVTFFEDEVNTASQRLVQQHATQFTSQRILRQVKFVQLVTSFLNKCINATRWLVCVHNFFFTATCCEDGASF